MCLKIDSREKQRITDAVLFAKDNDIGYEVKQLDTGDYVFKDGEKTVGFEYKTIYDFVSSIMMGKLFRQVSNMNYDYNFCFISGFKDLPQALSKYNRFSQNKLFLKDIYGVLLRLNTICDGVIYFECNTFEQELQLMYLQASKCFVMKNYNAVSDKKKGSNPAVTYLTCVNGVSIQKAELICNTYNINCLTDLFGLTKKLLTDIDGIGEKTAVKILNAIGG